MTRLARLVPLLTALAAATAGTAGRALAQPGLPLVRKTDLQRDLAVMGGDGMRGREAGTLDEMRATGWVAQQMREIGLRPMGEDGTFFQWWSMRRTRVSTPNSTVSLGGRPLALWQDVAPTGSGALDVQAATVWVDDGRDSTIDVRGRVAVARLVAPPERLIRTTTNTRDYNYLRGAITAQAPALLRRGAAAVILVADSVAERAFPLLVATAARGAYDVVGGVPRFARPAAGQPGRTPSQAPAAVADPRPSPQPGQVLVARAGLLETLRAGGAADLRLRTETFDYPSANVIGVVRGTDPRLRDEYVLYSSHQDHDGVRAPVNGDSIWNGADDNGTVSVALLAAARAFARHPAKRSVLFVFHGAEERGLLGSRYHVAHPVVPLDHIVAVLNGDMIGRNHPDTAALLGSQPPHRTSADLVRAALDANARVTRFVVDSSWDRPDHPEGWYFRSDHVPYAERGVPSLMFSTNLHGDYHTPRDEPRNIDYDKLLRMSRWMYATGWAVANAPKRPAPDPDIAIR